METDAKIYRTIQMSSTLLCIAHRIPYVRTLSFFPPPILTLDSYPQPIMTLSSSDRGKVAEFDTVLNLFDKADSIFRSLCDEANLQRRGIARIRAEHNVQV